MTKKAIFRRTLTGLAPDEQDARDMLDRYEVDERVRVTITRPRSNKQNDMFWAMCEMIAQNQNTYRNKEDVATAICIGVGHYDVLAIKETARSRQAINVLWRAAKDDPTLVTALGALADEAKTVKKRRSLSFANVGQDEFNEFMNRAIDFICIEIIPGLSDDGLRNELLEMAA